ncbi:MAG TPA: hypothetical protein VM638_05115 [Actinomycetota bacterium]|nr:hypothetical protein [Actinomycetota bacterium]
MSAGVPHLWRPGRPETAQCHWVAGRVRVPGVNHAPFERCRCGIYAFRELDHLIEQGPNPWVEPVVLGAVRLWGKVIVHDLGYRAQHAKVTEIFAVPGQEWLHDVARRYRAEVTDHLVERLAWYRGGPRDGEIRWPDAATEAGAHFWTGTTYRYGRPSGRKRPA